MASSDARAQDGWRCRPASWASDVELRVSDDGSGIDPDRLPGLLAGAGGGIGLANVDGRLRATFGERYALRLESELGQGTTAIMTVPNLVGEDGLRVAGAGGGSRAMSGDQLTILAVDDERTQLEDLARLLRNSPSVKEVECAYDGHDALVKASTQAYDAIFLDVRMPNLDGLELGRVLRRFAAPPQLVFVSAYDNAAVDAFELHALDYLRKPVGRRRVEEAIERVAAAVESGAGERRAADGARRPAAAGAAGAQRTTR